MSPLQDLLTDVAGDRRRVFSHLFDLRTVSSQGSAPVQGAQQRKEDYWWILRRWSLESGVGMPGDLHKLWGTIQWLQSIHMACIRAFEGL